jgi:hypothetical protein
LKLHRDDRLFEPNNDFQDKGWACSAPRRFQENNKKADIAVASPFCFGFGAKAPATEVGATRNSPCRSWRVMARPFGRVHPYKAK